MGKFITLTGSDGQFYFTLLAGNGKIILSSEGYTTEAARNNGIRSVQNNGFNNGGIERKISSDNKYYFVLKAPNGEVIGNSELYESEGSRDNGIESVKNNARDAVIETAG